MTDAPNTPNFDPMNAEHVRDAFLEKIAEAKARAAELKGAHERAPKTVESDEALSDYTTLVKALKECRKTIEAARKEEKGRYDACGKVIHDAAKYITDDLDKMAREGEGRMSAYQRRVAEEERKRREKEAEEARKAAQERSEALQSEEDLDAAIAAETQAQQAEREAQAKPADLHRARGEYGGVSSLRSVLAFEIKNAFEIPPTELWRFLTHEAIEKAVRAWMRTNQENVKRAVQAGEGDKLLRGVRFFEETKTTVR